MENSIDNKLLCYQCGQPCTDTAFTVAEKTFCSFGCKTVFEILQDNDLCAYGDTQNVPGRVTGDSAVLKKYAVLDRPDVKRRYITFSDGKQMHVKFYLPYIHCISCVWTLENLHTLHAGILHATVDFTRKEIFIIADATAITLKEIASVLDAAGYEPYLSYSEMGETKVVRPNRHRLIKLGIAGFCFGNIVIFSLPEYFAGGEMLDYRLQRLFYVLSLILALPVVFYCAQEFFTAAWKGLRSRILNSDALIALAITIAFFSSVIDIVLWQRSGYFDVLSGIVFFMLVGRYLQEHTFRSVTHDASDAAGLPMTVLKLSKGIAARVPLSELKSGDDYIVEDGEIIPADSVLISGEAHIHYSLVNGEQEPVAKHVGDLIYTGGRQSGGRLELCVIKEVSPGYLMQLWNSGGKQKTGQTTVGFVQWFSKYYGYIIIALSVCAFIFWSVTDTSRSLAALLSALVIACPCTLLLSSGFAYGNAVQRLGKWGLYLKNVHVFQNLQRITAVVFDISGLPGGEKSSLPDFRGGALSAAMQPVFAGLAKQFTHPLSNGIVMMLGKQKPVAMSGVVETPGAGIAVMYKGDLYEIGTASYICTRPIETSALFCAVNGRVVGRFVFDHIRPESLTDMLALLKKRYDVHVICSESERELLEMALPGTDVQCYYGNGLEKKQYIRELQNRGARLAVVGDGPQGAVVLLPGGNTETDILSLNASRIPGADAILTKSHLHALPALFAYARQCRLVVCTGYLASFTYIFAGVFFALQGVLSPVVAAILMPLSTIAIVIGTTGLCSLAAKSQFTNFRTRWR